MTKKRLFTVTSLPPGRRPLVAFFLRDERRFVTPQREQDLPEIAELIADGSIPAHRDLRRKMRRLVRP